MNPLTTRPKPEETRVATGENQTHVQFLDSEANDSVVVAFETSHRGGMLAPLVKSISDLQLEVHQIESRINDGVRSERLMVAAADGEPLSQSRQALLRTAVFSAVETMNRTTPEEHDCPSLIA